MQAFCESKGNTWICLVWGQLAALTTAAFWAVASILYHRAGAHFSALQMNLIKGAIASPLLFGMSALFGAPLVFSAGSGFSLSAE